MKKRPSEKLGKKGRGNQGYAILFVLFLMALVIIGGSVVVLDARTQGQRQKEEEMIWRGKEYQRAIRLFYLKFGRFPTSVDDLVKAQNGGIRFLREAYKNPTNKEDGTWRFIYVTPAGQLIGSVRYVSLQQMAFLDKQRQLGLASGAAGTASGTGETDNSNTTGDDTGTQPQTSGSATNSANAGAANPAVPPLAQDQNPSLSQVQGQGAAQLPGQNPQSANPPVSSFFSQPLQPQPDASGGVGVAESSGSTDETGQVIGGFIIGVAGKADKRSVKVYKGGKTYKQWEFIFNPLEQVATIGTLSSGPQTNPLGTQPGTPPAPQPPQQQPQIPQQPQ